MNNAISRRTFLKCAGTAAVAVGAASLLGGCSLFDNIINAGTKDMPAITINGITFSVTGAATDYAKPTEGKQSVKALVPLVGILDNNQIVGAEPKTLDKSIFSLKIDGVDADIKWGDEAQKIVNEVFAEDNEATVLDKNGKTKTGLTAVALVFVPKQPIEKWSKAVLTINYSGRSQSFELTYQSAFETDVVKK